MNKKKCILKAIGKTIIDVITILLLIIWFLVYSYILGWFILWALPLEHWSPVTIDEYIIVSLFVWMVTWVALLGLIGFIVEKFNENYNCNYYTND